MGKILELSGVNAGKLPCMYPCKLAEILALLVANNMLIRVEIVRFVGLYADLPKERAPPNVNETIICINCLFHFG